jgi:hypothetical protein
MSAGLSGGKGATSGGGTQTGRGGENQREQIVDRRLQDPQYRELLNRAGGVFEQPLTDYSQDLGRMEQILGDQAAGYMNLINQQTDISGITQANTLAAQEALSGTLGDIGSQARSVGGGSSSRRSIAEGVAAGSSAAQLAQANTQAELQAQSMDTAARQSGLAGLSDIQQQQAALTNMSKQFSPEQQQLDQLANYQRFISGDMGGTRTGDMTSDWWSDMQETSYGKSKQVGSNKGV